MVTIKELKEICKKNNVKLLPHWKKDDIIFQLYLETGIKIEKREDEIKKDERKAEREFIKFLSHDTQYFSRKDYIELYGLEYVEEIEQKYKKYLNFNYYPDNWDEF